jgi:hypothetical protein
LASLAFSQISVSLSSLKFNGPGLPYDTGALA